MYHEVMILPLICFRAASCSHASHEVESCPAVVLAITTILTTKNRHRQLQIQLINKIA